MKRSTIPVQLLGATLIALVPALPVAAQDMAPAPDSDNAVLIQQAFDAWRDGHGSVFDLLADDVEWTVAGSSPVSGRFHSRQAFIEHAVQPIHTRLATPISPQVKHILAQDDAVVVIWDGTATAVDGSTYRNSYAWHMVLEGGRVTRVVAFLDTWALNALLE